MRIGRCSELVAELRQLTAAYPLQERFHGQLMTALYRCGRKAEALTAFQLARAALVKEVGVEPGVHLHEIYRQMLQTDEHLDATADVESMGPPEGRGTRPAGIIAGTRSTSLPVPNQLPADIPDFTGRDEAIPNVLSALDSAKPPAVIIAGAGGMGKTALAVHVAHGLAHRYPDGQLYVSLHGSGHDPASTNAILRRMLRALGAHPATIPRDEEERAALYRSTLAGRRMLIILDDAASTARVCALLPGTAACAVIVTTRHCTLGIDGARWMFLEELRRGQAHTLIGRIIGQARAAAEPRAVDDLARLCADLPLAIRICGTRLAVRPLWTVQDVVHGLADERWRLRMLAADGHGARLGLALGHGSVSPALARAFGLLAASRVRVLSLPAVAALLDTGVEESRQLAELLVDMHLLCSPGQHRYRYRDLQYLYAREELSRTGPHEWGNAVRRLTTHYLSMLREASPSSLNGEAENIMALIADNSSPLLSNPDAVAQLKRFLKPFAGTGSRHHVPLPLTPPRGHTAIPSAPLMDRLPASR